MTTQAELVAEVKRRQLVAEVKRRQQGDAPSSAAEAPAIAPPTKEELFQQSGDWDFEGGNVLPNAMNEVRGVKGWLQDNYNQLKEDPAGFGGDLFDTANTVAELIGGDPEKMNAMVEGLREDYGGIDNIQRTIETRPLQSALDAAGLVFPATKAAKAVTKIPKVGPAAARIAKEAGGYVDNLYGGVLPQTMRRKMYRKGTALPNSLSNVGKDKVTDALMGEGVVNTRRGERRLKKTMNAITDDSQRIMDANPQTMPIGELIDPENFGRVTTIASKDPTNAQGIRSKIDKLRDQLERELMDEFPDGQIPMTKIQSIKTTAQKGGDYRDLPPGKKQANARAVEAYNRDLGDATRGWLDRAYPEIAENNARIGPLLSGQDSVKKAADKATSIFPQSAAGPFSLGGALASGLGGGAAVAAGAGGAAVPLIAGALAGVTYLTLGSALASSKIAPKLAVLLTKSKNPSRMKRWVANNPTATVGALISRIEEENQDAQQ